MILEDRDVYFILPASMLLVCALARHWHVLDRIRRDVERERRRIADELARFKHLLCL